MSKKHRKRPKQEHASHDTNPPPNHRNEEAPMAYTVRIEPNPDDKNRYTEEKNNRQDQLNASRRLNYISMVGVAVALLALIGVGYNAIIVHRQWTAMVAGNGINKTAFDRAYRPYIGENGVRQEHMWSDSAGVLHSNVLPTKEAKYMHFSLETKNFGPVPGTNYVAQFKVTIGGVELPMSKIPDQPFTFYPGQSAYYTGTVGTQDYRSVMSGNKRLILEITIDYDGPNGHYEECSTEEFSPKDDDFSKLGPCSLQKAAN